MYTKLLLALLLSLPTSIHASIELATGGKSRYAILISPDANPTERHAAEELQRYLQRIAAANLPIITSPGTTPFISVGDVDAAKTLTVPSRYDGDDGWRILTTNDGNFILKGAIPRGTLYAVYDFLESLGCRWFAPNTRALSGHHEYIPRIADLKLEPMDKTVQPLMKYRKRQGDYRGEEWKCLMELMGKFKANTLTIGIDKYEPERDIIKREIALRGMALEVGKHPVTQTLLPPSKYFKDHPDWYGMIGGKRKLTKFQAKDDSDRLTVMFETANADAVRTYIAALVDYLKSRPEIDVLQVWPPDGAVWSQSPESQKLGPPPERMALLVQAVDKAVKQAGLRTRISYLAYQALIPPPHNMNFGKDASIDYCPIRRSYAVPLDSDDCPVVDPRYKQLQFSFEGAVPVNALYRKYLIEWLKTFHGDITHYSYYAKGSWCSLPVAQPEQIAYDVNYWKKIGEVGTHLYMIPGDWLVREINQIAFSSATWDPDFDAAKWYDEYLRLRYGKAANAMKQYFAHTTRVCQLALIRDSAMGRPTDYRADVAEAKQCMAKAKALADTEDAKWMTDKLAWQVDYISNALELKILQGTKDKSESDAARVKELAAGIDELMKAHQGDGTANGRSIVRTFGLQTAD